MNEVLKAIQERFSCRDYTGKALSNDEVQVLAQAALASPSGMNLQPWHISIVTDKALIDEMDAVGMEVLASAPDKSAYERVMSRGGKIFYNAPCMVVLSTDGSALSKFDSGILVENVALAAHSIGLGSVICAMAGIPLGGPKGPELKAKLKFPEGYDFSMAILVGEVQTGKEPHELDPSKVTII